VGHCSPQRRNRNAHYGVSPGPGTLDGRPYYEEAAMSRMVKRLVHVVKYVAEVEVENIPDDEAWGPYLSLDDALKLERVEKALRAGDLKAAGNEARVYELKPIAAE
jgi:hypothetical protein